MTLDEALSILKKKMFLTKKPDRYVEYSNYFLLFMLPENAFDGVIMIDKSSKKIVPYNPLLIPKEEANSPVSKGKVTTNTNTIEHGRKVIEDYFKCYVK